MDLDDLKISLSEMVETATDARRANILDGVEVPLEAREYRQGPRSLMAMAEDPRGTVVGVAAGALLEHPEKLPLLYVVSVQCDAPYESPELEEVLIGALVSGAKDMGISGAWLGTRVLMLRDGEWS